METEFISACLSNDLVQATKMFEAAMAPRIVDLVEQRKTEIARSVMIEGEEPKDGEDKKDKKSDDADEGDLDDDEGEDD